MTSVLDHRSFLFRVGIMASQALLAMQPQKPLTERQATTLGEWQILLPKLIAFQRPGALHSPDFKAEDLSQFVSMREVIDANAWRFPEVSSDYFAKLLLTVGRRLKGEAIPAADLDAAKTFFQALSGSMLSALQDSETDDDD